MSSKNYGFKAERLQQVLSIRRINQAQLAAMVDVSPATISKWKSGKQEPEKAALERLASVINVQAEWFTRRTLDPLTMHQYRSNAAALKSARNLLAARLEWAQEIAEGLNEFVDFPEVILPTRDFRSPLQIDSNDIEEAALECREAWGLGRSIIPDLCMAAESAGIIVVREETGISQIEGLSAISSSMDRPFVFLSADKDNAFRSRFDLAHEIGHLILHRLIERSNDRETYNLMEKQAHAYAGALLLPAEAFLSEVRIPPSLDSLLLLKQRWGVSVGAMIMRLKQLKVISDDEATSLFKRKTQRWGAKKEPEDDSREVEQPKLLKRTFELLANEGVLPKKEIVRFFGLSEYDIRSLANLPERFFSKPAEILNIHTKRA